jgi:hypothetical protein
MLHRPFSGVGKSINRQRSQEEQAVDPISKFSRTTCYENAVRVVQILVVHSQYVQYRRLCISTTLHLVVVTMTLAALIQYPMFEHGCTESLRTLEPIAHNMGETYPVGRKVAIMIRSVLEGLENAADMTFSRIPDANKERHPASLDAAQASVNGTKTGAVNCKDPAAQCNPEQLHGHITSPYDEISSQFNISGSSRDWFAQSPTGFGAFAEFLTWPEDEFTFDTDIGAGLLDFDEHANHPARDIRENHICL